jgi:hypothetical protein
LHFTGSLRTLNNYENLNPPRTPLTQEIYQSLTSLSSSVNCAVLRLQGTADRFYLYTRTNPLLVTLANPEETRHSRETVENSVR